MSSELYSSSLLERAYVDLDLVGGTLLEAAAAPSADADAQGWSEFGEWLMLAARVNAERVFFVNGDPVLVFSSLPDGADDDDVRDCYRRTWSLARPRCLFLAVGDELRIYSLATTTPGPDQESLTPLEIVTRAADVGDVLARFHRERLESGAAFEDPQLAEQSGRADQQLLRDVRTATAALVEGGLTSRVAHTLIERAILVRYLEDRAVLTEDYFDAIASRHSRSMSELTLAHDPPDFGRPSRFIQSLISKDFTYDLFDHLAKDFNGDLFVPEADEREAVTSGHLRLLKDLL